MTKNQKIWTTVHIPLMMIILIGAGFFIERFWFSEQAQNDPLVKLQNYSAGGDYLQTMNTWPFHTGINGDTNYNSAEMMNARSKECNNRDDLAYFQHIAKHFENSWRIIAQYHYIGDKPSQKPLDYYVSFVPNATDYNTIEEFKQDFPICELGSDEVPLLVTPEWLVFTTDNCLGGAATDNTPTFSACEELKKKIENLLLEK
jgi:hypothetical protein